MKENWTCMYVLTLNPNRLIVNNFFDINKVINIQANEHTSIISSDIGVWKIKTKK